MQITINIPDKYTLDTTPVELSAQLKLYAALLLFQAGQLSAGAACEFAEVDRYTFIKACKQYKVPVINYDESDLINDLENLKCCLWADRDDLDDDWQKSNRKHWHSQWAEN